MIGRLLLIVQGSPGARPQVSLSLPSGTVEAPATGPCENHGEQMHQLIVNGTIPNCQCMNERQLIVLHDY